MHLSAGRGGDGVVRWRHEKGKPRSGPSGGNGGDGGDVFVEAIRDIGALARYRSLKEMTAGDGEAGRAGSEHGKDGKDLVLAVPIGTVVRNQRTGRTVELLNEGDREIILHGGKGGLGNEYFKGSTNTAPRQATEGKPGEEADFFFELQLVVDAGFVGLPNAGKSSLLNALTNARAKVGSFPFTTLDPNLGDLYGYILADIPGLIEGASIGKGLGHTFLRHIKRTKTLVHCVSLELEDPLSAYQSVRAELKAYDPALKEKPELVVLTKTDITTSEVVARTQALFAKEGKEAHALSILDDDSIKAFRDTLTQFLGGAGNT